METLLATLVVALAALGLGRLTGELRWSLDLSHQRAAAIRALQSEAEAARAFVSVAAAGAGSWGETGVGTAPWSVNDGLTSYLIERTSVPSAGVALHRLQLRARWADRRGAEHALTLRYGVGAIDPAWSTALALPPAGARSGDRLGRSPLLPIGLLPLADGHAAWQPPLASHLYFVLDPLSARVVARCTSALPAPGGSGCAHNMDGSVLAGFVAFHVAGLATTAGAREPTGAARRLAGVHVELAIQGATPPTAECFDDSAQAAASGRHHVAYTCVIVGIDHDDDQATPRRWSGRATLATDGSWTIGGAAGQSRICRYSVDHDGLGIGNADHPLDYADVHEALANQNYLVIDAAVQVNGQLVDNACPVDTQPSGIGAGSAHTVAHQPAAAP